MSNTLSAAVDERSALPGFSVTGTIKSFARQFFDAWVNAYASCLDENGNIVVIEQ